MLHPFEGCVEDEKRDHHQRDRIHQRRQHSRAVVAVSLRGARRAGLQIHRHEREQQRQEVRKIVAGFGEQRQGMGANAGNDQQHDVPESHAQRHLQDSRSPLTAVGVHVHALSLSAPDQGFKAGSDFRARNCLIPWAAERPQNLIFRRPLGCQACAPEDLPALDRSAGCRSTNPAFGEDCRMHLASISVA